MSQIIIPSAKIPVSASDVVLQNGDTVQEFSEYSGGSSTLDGLTDVVITTPINGQALIYDGTQWENTSLPGGGDMLKVTYDPQNIADDAFDRANHTGTQDISTITGLDYTKVAYPTANKIGNPTHIDTLQEIFNHEYSSGVMHGADLTDNGDGTITLSAGVGMLRASTDPHTTLYAIEFAQQTLTLINNATNYVSLSYNSGTPTFITSTSETSFNCLDVCIAYVITRRGTSIKWADAREQNVDGNRKSRRLFLDFSRFIHTSGGTILGGTGLNINVTAGSFYFMLQKILHSAFNTTVAGTANENVFTLAYRNGAGGHTLAANSKAVSTTLYDSGTGTLTTLGNNKFGVTWFYILNDNPSQLFGVVGQVEYPDLATARNATPPTDIPFELQGLGALIGLVIYEKSATSFAQVLSAFSTTFGASQATSHNSLAGLQGGAIGEYNHLTNAELTKVNATTLAGKGITDAYTKTEVENLLDLNFLNYYTKTEIDNLIVDGGTF